MVSGKPFKIQFSKICSKIAKHIQTIKICVKYHFISYTTTTTTK